MIAVGTSASQHAGYTETRRATSSMTCDAKQQRIGYAQWAGDGTLEVEFPWEGLGPAALPSMGGREELG